MTRGARTGLLTASLVTTLCLAADEARASLIGVDVTVTLVDGLNTDVDVVTVGIGPEIVEGDSTNIGGFVFLEGEFLDFGDSSFVYQVRGDGATPHPSDPDYWLTGFDPAAHFIFAFDLPPGDQILSVMLVIGPAIIGLASSDVTFTGNSVTLPVGTLGVLEVAGPDLGTIQLNLTLQSTGPPVGAVPEPSSLAALGLGLAALGWRRYRRG